MLERALLLIMISLVDATYLRTCQRSNNSSEDDMLLRKEMSGISPYEVRADSGMKEKALRNRGKGAILLIAAEEHSVKKQVPITDRVH